MLLTHDTKYLVTGAEGVVKIFSTASFTLIDSFRPPEPDICLMLLDPHNRYLVITAEHSFCIYDFPARRLLLHRVFDSLAEIRCAYFFEHAGLLRLLLCSKVHGVMVVSENFETVPTNCFTLEPRPKFLEGILIQSRFFIAYAESGTVFLWDIQQQCEAQRRPGLQMPMPMLYKVAEFENILINDAGSFVLFIYKSGLCFYNGNFARLATRSEQPEPRGLRNLTSESNSRACFFPVFELKFSRLVKDKSRTSASALNDRFAAVAINTMENSESNQEAFNSAAELYFFHCSTDGTVTLLHSIDEQKTKINLRVSIFCVESCPRSPEVFALGDSEGQIVLWSALTATPIYVSKQFCRHLPMHVASISNPLCDIKFLPSGLEFFASTFYGAICFYSAFCADFASVAFAEQFSPADFNVAGVACLMDSGMTPLHPNPTSSFAELDLALHLKLIEHGADQHARQEELRRENFEFEHHFKTEIEKCEQKIEFLNLKAMSVPLPPTLPLAKRMTETMREEVSEQDAKSEENRRVSEDESECGSGIHFDQKLSRGHSRDVFDNACGHCRTRGNLRRCRGCQDKCCPACEAFYFMPKSSLCVLCFLTAKRNERQDFPEDAGRRCDREAFDQFSLQPGYHNCPQIGQTFVFVPGSFRCFLREFAGVFDAEPFLPQALEVLRFSQDTIVHVLDYTFSFPVALPRNAFNQRPVIFQQLKLCVGPNSLEATLPFHPLAAPEQVYLIPHKLYSSCRPCIARIIKNLGAHTFTHEGKKVQIVNYGRAAGSMFKCLELAEVGGARVSFDSAAGPKRLVSPWEFQELQTSFLYETPCPELLQAFSGVLADCAKKHPLFFDDVSKKEYPDYLDSVPVQMNLKRIKARCDNNFYLSLQELHKQVKTIKTNAEIYNEKSSPVVFDAQRVERKLFMSLEMLEKQRPKNIVSLTNLGERAPETHKRPPSMTALKRVK